METPGTALKWGNVLMTLGGSMAVGDSRFRRGQVEEPVRPWKLSSRLHHRYSVAFWSPAKRLVFSGLMETTLVGKKSKS